MLFFYKYYAIIAKIYEIDMEWEVKLWILLLFGKCAI